MSIEIDVLNGNTSWPAAEPLFKIVWSPEIMANKPWRHIKWANADLRVLVETPDDGLACHVGIYFRDVTWNGRKFHIGGIGGVATHPDHRRHGYASVALNAAIQTMRDHEARRIRPAVLRAAQFRVLSIAWLASLRGGSLRRTTGRASPLRGHGALHIPPKTLAADGRDRPMRIAVVTNALGGDGGPPAQPIICQS